MADEVKKDKKLTFINRNLMEILSKTYKTEAEHQLLIGLTLALNAELINIKMVEFVRKAVSRSKQNQEFFKNDILRKRSGKSPKSR